MNQDDKIIKEKHNSEEWGGWKIVSNMLDNSDENGIYPTSECYQKLYDFVCEQKRKAQIEILERAIGEEIKETYPNLEWGELDELSKIYRVKINTMNAKRDELIKLKDKLSQEYGDSREI